MLLFAQRQWIASALVLMIFFAYVVLQTGWLALLLRTGPMGFLGRISYSLYLVHPFALEALRIGLHHGTPHGSIVNGAPWMFWVIGPAFAIAASWLCYAVLEKSFTQWLGARLALR
jgi:peptidoglycan/LPS O-acetylase OafA/YrhL